jgi:DNA-binding transcriptional LysR family regulator
MNLRTLDLNLLLVFDAIYGERSISKAALKLHLSQPTVSNALARLRERLGDPLFERQGQGMRPTPRAKKLAEPIRQALHTLERGLRDDDTFDFAHSEREFVIAVEDYGESVILPGFVRWLSEVAPRIRIHIRTDGGAPLRAELREGQVDLALDYFPVGDAGFSSTCVITETLMTLSRRDHPLLGERLSLEQYVALSHVVLRAPSNQRPMIDLALAKRGLQRRITVWVPRFISMPLIVQASDMIGTLPRRMATLYADHFRLKAYTVPLRVPQFPVYLIWHESLEPDAGHRWFRQHLIDFCQRL